MLRLPHYTSRDLAIMLWTLIPFATLLNIIIFGREYVGSIRVFGIATPVTFIVLALSFLFYGNIAVAFRQRFPGDDYFFKRTGLLILLFLTMTALIIFGLYRIYNLIGLLGDSREENNFTWAYIATGILNIFLTFLNEGIYRFESWKANIKESEELKIAYKESQLISLRSQVNPHFLFNSLNSLSGLIQEDTHKAESFLDEMSKVYRYMLRNDDDPTVKLSTEIQFISSYFSLLKARYGEAIELRLDIAGSDMEKSLPPLSLHVLVDNALYQNITSKNSPLKIVIASGGNNNLLVKNNVQRKMIVETADNETALDNLIRKYQLMSERPVEIHDSGDERTIVLPLISRKEEVVA